MMKRVVFPKTGTPVRDKRTKEQLAKALDAAERDADESFDRLKKMDMVLQEVRQELYAKRCRISEMEMERFVLVKALEHMVASALATMSPLTFWRTLRSNAKLLKMELSKSAAQRIENACRDISPLIVTTCRGIEEELERTLSNPDDE